MKTKKILVCGANGFIGWSIFSDLLLRHSAGEVFGTYFLNEDHVLNSDPRSRKFLYADLTKQEDVDRVVKGSDIIIQAAARTAGMKVIKEHPQTLLHDNLSMNARIFEAAHRFRVSRVIFLSCSVMYDQLSPVPTTESDLDLNKPMSDAYFGGAWMKVYLEKLCEFYARLGRTKYTVIRHSNVYGPGDKFDPDRSHVTAATIQKVADAKDGGGITVWGRGKEKKDLLYISDLTEFIFQSVSRGQRTSYDVMNVGSGTSISVRGLVELAVQASGKKLSVEYDASKPSAYSRLVLDISKAKATGWSPRVSIKEGVRRTYEWYQMAKNADAKK